MFYGPQLSKMSHDVATFKTGPLCAKSCIMPRTIIFKRTLQGGSMCVMCIIKWVLKHKAADMDRNTYSRHRPEHAYRATCRNEMICGRKEKCIHRLRRYLGHP